MSKIGDNSALTENEEKALFFHHLRKDAEHQAVIKAAQAARKADRKLAQAEGIVLADLDYAQRAINADDKGIITARHLQQSKINFWLGLSSGYQTDLFIDRAPGIERIEKEGEQAGFLAADRFSPYEAMSDEDQAWLRGYDRAQKIMAENLQSAMEKVNAAAKEGDELIQSADADDPFADDQLQAAE